MGNRHTGRSGFTLVEVVVVIAVIAILATLATIGLNGYLEDSRDTKRVSSVTTLSEALEKYYDTNGEYPSCADMSASLSSVTSTVLPGIDASALITPTTSGSTNSITCDNLDTVDGDYYEYRGDGSSTCATGGACLSYTLRYKEEASGDIKEVASRRTASLATSGTATLSASGTGLTQLTANWNAVANALNYTVEVAQNSSFSTIVATQTATSTSATINSLGYNTSYFVRVRATSTTSQGAWSNTATASTLAISAPTSLAVTPVNSSQATLSWAGVNGATGYTLQWSVNQSTWNNVATTSTSSPVTGLSGGTLYYYRVIARWNTNNSSPSSVVSRHTHPNAPSSVTVAAAMSGSNAIGTASASCSAGTAEYRLRARNTNTSTMGAWSTWSAWSTTNTRSNTTSVGSQYGFEAEAQCTLSSLDSASTTSNIATTVRNFTAPSAPSVTASTPSTTTTFTRSAVTCPGNGTPQYQYLRTREGITYSFITSTATTVSTSSSGQGYQYGLQWQARCSNTYSTSPWSASGSASYIRPVSAPTGRSFGGGRGAWNIMYLYIYGSCGSGATLHGRYDAHTWDWGWTPGNHIGWRRSSLGWISGASDSYWANTVTTGSQSSSGIPSGSRWNVGSEYRCQNSVTGRNSGGKIWQESGIYTAS